MSGKGGFHCKDCGHQHTGNRFAFICIGCPCEKTGEGPHDRTDCPCGHRRGTKGACAGCNCADDPPEAKQ